MSIVQLRTVLVDDEKSSLKSLQYDLEEYCPEVRVIEQFNEPEEALAQIPGLKPDLVFLDIEMPGMDGFDLLQKLPEVTFDVIFVTAYNQFAIKAFDFNAADYVLKPVRKAKLIQAVQRVVENQERGLESTHLEALVHNIHARQQPPQLQSIALPTSEGFSMVNVAEIVYLQAESNYTWVHVSNKQKHLISRTLKEFAGMLDYPYYFRPHKSYLVNLNFLDKYVRGQGGYLVLKSGVQIPVARNQKNELLRILNV